MALEEAWHLRLCFDLNTHKHPSCVNSPNIHKQKRQIFKRWQIQAIVKSKIGFPKLWYRQRCIGWILASPNLYRSLFSWEWRLKWASHMVVQLSVTVPQIQSFIFGLSFVNWAWVSCCKLKGKEECNFLLIYKLSHQCVCFYMQRLLLLWCHGCFWQVVDICGFFHKAIT